MRKASLVIKMLEQKERKSLLRAQKARRKLINIKTLFKLHKINDEIDDHITLCEVIGEAITSIIKQNINKKGPWY